VSTLLRGYLGANDLTQDSLMAEVPFCESVCNIGLQRYKAIRNAFLAAPPATSFLTFISQTHEVHSSHARPAPELTNTGPEYAPAPTRISFEVTWAKAETELGGFFRELHKDAMNGVDDAVVGSYPGSSGLVSRLNATTAAFRISGLGWGCGIGEQRGGA
jgi:hypothetical protein